MTVDSFNKLLSKLSTATPTEGMDAERELLRFNVNELIPQLISIINDTSEVSEIRTGAVKGLQWMKHSYALAKIKDTLLHDFDNNVRIAIIELIGTLKEASMMPTLTKLVNRDDDPEVIRAASLAIQIIQGITPEWSFDS